MKYMKAASVVAGLVIAAGGATPVFADAGAEGAAIGSPGVLSGNLLQVPVHLPINVCGNTVSVIGALNPAFGNTCVNED
ncbi:chaplin [Streptomyces sp. NPDC050485]|uniref:chaplin n=1 Tax=Streptomyces sp. NPDC050485 TaxID=3365617 RepID=UPI0037B30FF8